MPEVGDPPLMMALVQSRAITLLKHAVQSA
jgi:hypothetical protein